MLLLSAATLVPFALLAAWARLQSPGAWEAEIVAGLALGTDAWADAVRAVNALGSLPIWAVVVGALAALLWPVRGVLAAVLVALSYLADLAAFAVKMIVERARPETVATEHFFGPDNFAFPSGHVVRAVALAAVVAWLAAPVRVRLRMAVAAATLAGLVMGYARVALGVHWPTDALGGTLLGLAWFGLTVAALRVPR